MKSEKSENLIILSMRKNKISLIAVTALLLSLSGVYPHQINNCRCSGHKSHPAKAAFDITHILKLSPDKTCCCTGERGSCDIDRNTGNNLVYGIILNTGRSAISYNGNNSIIVRIVYRARAPDLPVSYTSLTVKLSSIPLYLQNSSLLC